MTSSLRLHIALCAVMSAAMVRAGSPQRYALLIGINSYQVPVGSQIAAGAWRTEINDLKGAENDADSIQAILVSQYQWPTDSEHLIVLKSAQASRKAILGALDSLASKVHPGDKVFIFYSGHGSTVHNSLTKKLLDDSNPPIGVSNTIVPADTLQGVPDISDKELGTAFNKILQGHAVLTAVFDSCYSGSIAREGLVLSGHFKSVASPNVEQPNLDIKETDPTPAPADQGALIISASQPNELSEELDFTDGPTHGAFTKALVDVLQSDDAHASVDQIFEEASARLQTLNQSQHAFIQGLAARKHENLIGDDPQRGQGFRLYVRQHPVDRDFPVILNGGVELGLHKNSVLTASLPNQQDAVATVTTEDVGASKAAFTSGDQDTYTQATSFRVTSWAVGDYPGLRLYVPRATQNISGLLALYSAVSTAAGPQHFVTAPLGTPYNSELLFTKQGWEKLAQTGGEPKHIDLSGSHPNLALGSSETLFMSLPLAGDASSTLKFSPDQSAMITEVTDLTSNPDYMLVGKVTSENKLVYGWVALGAGTSLGPIHSAPDPNETVSDVSPMPKQTTWYDATRGDLADCLLIDAKRLASLKNWTLLTSHDDGKFPYHFELVEAKTGTTVPNGGTVKAYKPQENGMLPQDAVRYRLRIVKDIGEAIDANTPTRFLYATNVDTNFTGTQVNGRTGGDIIFKPNNSDTYDEPFGDFGFDNTPGIESFILVTCQAKVDRDLFNFDGFTNRGPKSNSNPFEMLVGGLQGSSRSRQRDPVPSTWSVQRLFFKKEMGS